MNRLQALLRRERQNRGLQQRPPAQQLQAYAGYGIEQIINNRAGMGRGRPFRYHGPLPIPRRGGPAIQAPKRAEPSVERIKVEDDLLR